jgi:hypothetical protein
MSANPKRIAKLVIQACVVALAAPLGAVAGVIPMAHADTVRVFIINHNPHPIAIMRYKTLAQPSYTNPAKIIPGPGTMQLDIPHDDKVSIDFDFVNDAGVSVGPAANIEIDKHSTYVQMVCWGARDRACSPKGWADTRTVEFWG